MIDNGYGLRKIRKGSPKNLRSREPQGSLAFADEANWFRPGDLPEPLNGWHFPPINKALSSNAALFSGDFGSALPAVSAMLGCGGVLILVSF